MNSKLIIAIFCFIIYSCNQNSKSPKKARSPFPISTSNLAIDTSNSEVYSFLKILIATKNLDTTYGLILEPLSELGLTDPDSISLKSLLSKNGIRKETPRRKGNTYMIGGLDKCLSKQDIEFMLIQKNKNSSFKWDSLRLNFKSTNKFGERYVFSLPLYSLDRTKFLIGYENFFGTGRTVLFIKKGDKWESQETLGWIH